MQKLQPGDPEQVGAYRLLGRLGAGGMGQVFLGRSVGGRLIAVKIIRAELAGDAGFRARFAREVAAAQKVSGLFTALVVDADIAASVPWLATAYVAGPSLDQAVAEQGPLPASAVLTLAAGLAESLAAIHKAGVVHRDLKPSNVLLAADGPRVIDFGISKAAEESPLTQSGFIMGSPGFISPEQAKGENVGPESDIFSLGAVLAFAATGEGPFGSGSADVLLYRVVHNPPKTDLLPGRIRSLAERCLVKNPAQRPTAAELQQDLGAAQLSGTWLPSSFTTEFQQYRPLDSPQIPHRPVGGDGDVPSAKRLLRPPADATPQTQPPSGHTATTIRTGQPQQPGPGAPNGSTAVGNGTAAYDATPAPTRPRPGSGRRGVVVFAAVAATVVIAGATATVVLLAGGSGGNPSSTANAGTTTQGTFSENGPWRLKVVDNISGTDNGCTITLTDARSGQPVLPPESVYRTNPLKNAYETNMFQFRQAGSFRWKANDPRCLVAPVAGSGADKLPLTWSQGGDSDAFVAPARVAVKVNYFNGNSSCLITLIDPVNGQVIDTGMVTDGKNNNMIVLDTGGRRTAYLANTYCRVRVSASP